MYFGNRLNQNLREDHGYTYGARSSLSADEHVGEFSAGASVRNEVTDSAVMEILHEFNVIRTQKVAADELQKVKNVLNGAFARSLESPETIARFALNTARYKLPKDYYATYLEKLSEVTAEDVMAMAQKYIKPENAHIVVVGSQDDVANDLRVFAKNGPINFYNNSYEKIEAPARVLPADMTAEKVIDNYLQAIGGNAKLKDVNAIETKMSGKLQGMKIEVEVYQKSPDKFASLTMLNGSVLNAEILNGNKGKISGMAGNKDLEGAELNELKERAVPFKELRLKELGYTMELAGIENVEGKDAYKVKLTNANGSKGIDFYDMDTHLKNSNHHDPGARWSIHYPNR